MAIFRLHETPLRGRRMQMGLGINRDFGLAIDRSSMTGANNKCDGERAVYRTDDDTHLCLLQHGRPRRRKENTTNLFIRRRSN